MPVLWDFCCIKSGCDYSAKAFDALRRANKNQSNNLILRKNSNSI